MEKYFGFYDDDGNPIDPNLFPKPALCVSCKKNDDLNDEMVCAMTRLDQQGTTDFECFAYERVG